MISDISQQFSISIIDNIILSRLEVRYVLSSDGHKSVEGAPATRHIVAGTEKLRERYRAEI